MIILMGQAGSGKSLQGRLLADEYGYAWISTGEILRVLITGKRRQEMLTGKLLSDQEMIQIMDKVLELIDIKQEFVLDGFPRTKPQAEWLLRQVKQGCFRLTAIFDLIASEDVVRERLSKRGRPDDTPDAIATRFQEHQAVTLPILKYFQSAGTAVHDIDGEKSPLAVHQAIIDIIHARLP
ncbi:MAG: adenylate kinase family protein [Candidatus Saccharimonadales bacterium]